MVYATFTYSVPDISSSSASLGSLGSPDATEGLQYPLLDAMPAPDCPKHVGANEGG